MPGRGRAEQRARPGREVLQAAGGQAEEDRQPGDRPEHENLSCVIRALHAFCKACLT